MRLTDYDKEIMRELAAIKGLDVSEIDVGPDQYSQEYEDAIRAELVKIQQERASAPPPPPPEEQPDTDYGAIQALQNFLYGSVEGAGRMAQDLGATDVGGAIRDYGRRGVERNPVAGDLLGGLTDEGNILGAGGTATGITELLGQMSPLLAGGWAGAKAGALLGAPTGLGALPASIGGGIIGTLLSMLPSAYEDQATRQEEMRGGEFEPTAKDIAKRYGAAVGEGLIESVGGPQRILYSGILKSLAKKGVKNINHDLIAKVVKDARPDDMGRLVYRGRKALDSALTEALEENLQSINQRVMAGQDLLSEDALEEYKYGTAGGLIGGGLLGGAMVNTTSRGDIADRYWKRGEPGGGMLPPPPEGPVDPERSRPRGVYSDAYAPLGNRQSGSPLRDVPPPRTPPGEPAANIPSAGVETPPVGWEQTSGVDQLAIIANAVARSNEAAEQARKEAEVKPGGYDEANREKAAQYVETQFAGNADAEIMAKELRDPKTKKKRLKELLKIVSGMQQGDRQTEKEATAAQTTTTLSEKEKIEAVKEELRQANPNAPQEDTDAIQKQGPEGSVPREEESEVELQGVGEENAEGETLTEAQKEENEFKLILKQQDELRLAEEELAQRKEMLKDQTPDGIGRRNAAAAAARMTPAKFIEMQRKVQGKTAKKIRNLRKSLRSKRAKDLIKKYQTGPTRPPIGTDVDKEQWFGDQARPETPAEPFDSTKASEQAKRVETKYKKLLDKEELEFLQSAQRVYGDQIREYQDENDTTGTPVVYPDNVKREIERAVNRIRDKYFNGPSTKAETKPRPVNRRGAYALPLNEYEEELTVPVQVKEGNLNTLVPKGERQNRAVPPVVAGQETREAATEMSMILTERMDYMNDLIGKGVDKKKARSMATEKFPETKRERRLKKVMMPAESKMRDEAYTEEAEAISDAMLLLRDVSETDIENAVKAVKGGTESRGRNWNIANALDTLASAKTSATNAMTAARDQDAEGSAGMANIARAYLQDNALEEYADAVAKQRRKDRKGRKSKTNQQKALERRIAAAERKLAALQEREDQLSNQPATTAEEANAIEDAQIARMQAEKELQQLQQPVEEKTAPKTEEEKAVSQEKATEREARQKPAIVKGTEALKQRVANLYGVQDADVPLYTTKAGLKEEPVTVEKEPKITSVMDDFQANLKAADEDIANNPDLKEDPKVEEAKQTAIKAAEEVEEKARKAYEEAALAYDKALEGVKEFKTKEQAHATAEQLRKVPEKDKALKEAAKAYNEAREQVQNLKASLGVQGRARAALKRRNSGDIMEVHEDPEVEAVLQDVTQRYNLLPSIIQGKKGGSINAIEDAITEAFEGVDPENLNIYRSRTAAIRQLAKDRGISYEEASDLVDPSSAAFYDEATGKIYMNASNIPAEHAAGVLLHETVHDKLRSDKDIAPQYQKLVQRGVGLFNGPSTIAKRARARAEQANTKDPEESLAYLIEEAQNDYGRTPPSIMRWLKDLVSQMKVWLNKLGFMSPRFLTTNDLRVMFSNKLREQNMPKKLNTAEKTAGRILNSLTAIHRADQDRMTNDKLEQKRVNAPDAPTLESTGTLLSDLFFMLPGQIQKPIVEAIRSATKWADDIVITPLHIAAEKNPFAVLTKMLLKDRDSITQSNLKFFSKFYEDLENSGLSRQEIDDVAKIVRALSENNLMYNYLNEKELEDMRTKFSEEIAPAIKRIAETITDTKAIANLLEDTAAATPEAQKINAYIEEMFDRALAMQPDFQRGIVRTKIGKQDIIDDKRREVGTPEEIRFKVDPKTAEKFARQIHRTISRAAVAIAISRYGRFNEIKLGELQGLAALMNLPRGISAKDAMQPFKDRLMELVDAYGAKFEKSEKEASKLMDAISEYSKLGTQTERSQYLQKHSGVLDDVRKPLDDIVTGFGLNDEQRKTFSDEVKSRITHLHMGGGDADSFFDRAFQTITNFYIPHQRLKKHIAYVKYEDRSGRYTTLDTDYYPAMVVDFDTAADAQEFVDNFNSDMADQWFKTAKKPPKGIKGEKQEVEVRMQADFDERNYKDYVPSEPADLTFDAINRVFENSEATITPEQKTKLVKHMMVSLKKKRLAPYKAAIGFRYEDSLQSIADYLNGSAYVISANYFDHRIDSYLEMSNWRMGRVKDQIARIEERLPYATGTLLAQEQEKLVSLRRLYEHTKDYDNKAGDIQDLMRSAVYRSRMEASRESQVFDKLSRAAMRWTTVATLGLNISTAITQIVTLPIVIPAYLANSHGYLHSEFVLARNIMSLLGSGMFTNLTKTPSDVMQQRVKAMQRKDPDRAAFWEHVALQMKEGRLQIGQVLAVTGTAHEGIKLSNKLIRKAADAAMQPFALSEALVRTATFMTAYDLEVGKMRKNAKNKGKLTAENIQNSEELKKIFEQAVEIGDRAVELTQGEYADWARAPGLQNKYVRPFTMFWHYPQVQVALMRQMLKDNKQGAMLYLAGLFAVAGADGFPFSEFLKGIVDMLSQEFPQLFGKFGTKAFDGNVRHFLREEWAKPIEEGLSELTGADMTEAFSKGIISNILGVDLSFKMGLGAPFGNMSGHQVTDLLGPVGSVGKLVFDSGVEIKNGVMDAAAGYDPSPSFKKAMLKMPVSAFRNIYKGLVIGDKGYYPTREGLAVTDTSLDAVDAFVQALGWMPLEAGSQYSQADIQQRYLNMQRDMTADVNALAGQYIRDKDYEGYRELARRVREKNRLWRKMGSPLRVNWTPSQHRKRAQTGEMTVTRRTEEKIPKNLKRLDLHGY